MNKLHWISVLLPDAPDDVVQFLVYVSFEATKDKRKYRKTKTTTAQILRAVANVSLVQGWYKIGVRLVQDLRKVFYEIDYVT